MLTINNERRIVMAEIEQRNMGERMSLEEEERLMKKVAENNEKIIKLQKQLGELQVVVGEKKRKNRGEDGGKRGDRRKKKR